MKNCTTKDTKNHEGLERLLKTIQSETMPIEGHSDPNAINDCWNEVFELLQNQEVESREGAKPQRLKLILKELQTIANEAYWRTASDCGCDFSEDCLNCAHYKVCRANHLINKEFDSESSVVEKE